MGKNEAAVAPADASLEVPAAVRDAIARLQMEYVHALFVAYP